MAGMRRARAPGVALRGRHVVPAAAVLVVQDDDRRVRPQRAVLHGMHDVGGPLLAGQNGRVARMLVELAVELDERDARQLARGQVDVELRLVLQPAPRGRRDRRSASRHRGRGHIWRSRQTVDGGIETACPACLPRRRSSRRSTTARKCPPHPGDRRSSACSRASGDRRC